MTLHSVRSVFVGLLFLLGPGGLTGSSRDDGKPSPDGKWSPRSPQEFIDAVKTAYADRDTPALRRLVCWDRVDANARGQMETVFHTRSTPVRKIGFKDLTGDEMDTFTSPEGVTYELNLAPMSLLEILFEPTPTMAPTAIVRKSWTVGIRGGVYLFTGWAPVDTLPPPDEDPVAASGELPPEERPDLETYYAGTLNGWDLVEQAIGKLGHPNRTLQGRGCRVLLYVLEDALRREAASAVPEELKGIWRPWNLETYRERAHDLREMIGNHLGSDLYASAIPIATFFLERESAPWLELKGLEILLEIPRPVADPLILETVEVPRENHYLTAMALDLAAERGLRPSRERLVELAEHDRPSVALAARRLGAALGMQLPPPHDTPVVKPGTLAAVMARLDSMAIYDPVPRGTPLLEVTLAPVVPQENEEPFVFSGMAGAGVSGQRRDSDGSALRLRAPGQPICGTLGPREVPVADDDPGTSAVRGGGPHPA
jgi:hypothetical protein